MIRVSFDRRRRRWVYRLRFPRDVKRTIPAETFRRAGVPHDEETSTARSIAERWVALHYDLSPDLRADRVDIADLANLYHAENPGQIQRSTIIRNLQMARHLMQHLRVYPPSEIGIAEASRYRDIRLEEGAAPRSVRNEIQLLKQLLTFGYSRRRVTGMRELQLLTLPRIRLGERRGIALSVDQIRAVLETIRLPRSEGGADHDGEKWRSLLIVGIGTLLRRSPLLALRGEWIDETRAWLSIPGRGWSHQGRGPKGSKGAELPLSSVTLAALRGRMGNGYVWRNHRGNAPKWPRRTILGVCEAAGVPVFTCHDLRRTGTTLLESAGVSRLVIQQMLGHAGGDVTDGYVRIDREARLREAVAVLDEILEPIV